MGVTITRYRSTMKNFCCDIIEDPQGEYVTLADHEAALANERMPPDGYSLVETAAYNGLREAMIAVVDENAALKKALAEKNKEIERLKAALAERDRIIAKACKSLHDSSRALLDELDRVRADFQQREQHLLVMYGYLWQ